MVFRIRLYPQSLPTEGNGTFSTWNQETGDPSAASIPFSARLSGHTITLCPHPESESILAGPSPLPRWEEQIQGPALI